MCKSTYFGQFSRLQTQYYPRVFLKGFQRARRQNNMLTNPEDIASKIYTQQSISNRPTVPTCHYLNAHPRHRPCGVRQYPWHDLEKYTIVKREEPQTPLHTYFDQETYDFYPKNLTNNKVQGPYKIPNSFLKNMPPRFHKLLFQLFKHCYKQNKFLHHEKLA